LILNKQLVVVNKKILFLVAHRLGRSPGQRFRFEQYLDYLHKNGFQSHISYLIDESDDDAFYSSGRFFAKFRILLKSIRKRWHDLKLAKNFDIVFLYRDAIMLGTTFFEKRLKKLGIPIVIDFDDSIWLNDVSDGNRSLAFLKRPSKTPGIIKLCDTVFVGNKYLADFAAKYNTNVKIVPTTIDTEYYVPFEKTDHNPVCIGWTGSSTTLKHLSMAVPVLKKIRKKYGDKVYFKVISNEPLLADIEGLENVKWKKETEISDLNKIDIGIMPLPDNQWTRGKCGFKGLQYMALEIPAVMSPVGVNNEIIDHGKNGFLATDDNDWYEKLCTFIDSFELRRRLGKEGRKTVIEKYSFNSQKDIYLNYFRELVNN